MVTDSPTLHQFDQSATGALIVRPLAQESLALALTTLVSTAGSSYTFPLITEDPTAAWVAEGGEIPTSQAAADSITVTPTKLAGLSIISSELADDTSPEAAELIQQGLARDMAKKVDAAFFAPDAPANGSPIARGLESVQYSWLGAAPEGLAPFIDALAIAESKGATVSAWVTTPAIASQLAKLTVSEDSALPLFGTGATNGIQRQVLGIPLYVSSRVEAGVVWGIPSDRSYTIIRTNIDYVVDRSRFLEFDKVAIRAIMRIAFAFPDPTSIVKISSVK
ncbi:phage major capsid protein [Rathayibacter sp. AY2B3]|uniref:phage major capsid protein n=1 Tax=Rathayibacter sp. AY2B3 TaxID=2080569 RepID=UPI0015E2DD61|nr:phage major capsid protein [Rathayibacter sp. AY2B3]